MGHPGREEDDAGEQGGDAAPGEEGTGARARPDPEEEEAEDGQSDDEHRPDEGRKLPLEQEEGLGSLLAGSVRHVGGGAGCHAQGGRYGEARQDRPSPSGCRTGGIGGAFEAVLPPLRVRAGRGPHAADGQQGAGQEEQPEAEFELADVLAVGPRCADGREDPDRGEDRVHCCEDHGGRERRGEIGPQAPVQPRRDEAQPGQGQEDQGDREGAGNPLPERLADLLESSDLIPGIANRARRLDERQERRHHPEQHRQPDESDGSVPIAGSVGRPSPLRRPLAPWRCLLAFHQRRLPFRR